MTVTQLRDAVGHAPDCPGRRHPKPRVDLFGVEVDPLTMDESVDAVLAMVRCGLPHQHVCLNAAKVVELDHNRSLADAISGCDLVNVDGQAVVWAAGFLGKDVPERVAGVDLFERLLTEAEQRGLRVYFLGAGVTTQHKMGQEVERRWPKLRVAGRRDGFWLPEEEDEIVGAVAAAKADLLFLALPSPRKELFLEKHAEALGVPFRMGVGGSFDVLAGVTKRAPGWMQRSGLEWFFRFAQEPRRMFKRYLYGNTSFALLAMREGRREKKRAARERRVERKERRTHVAVPR